MFNFQIEEDTDTNLDPVLFQDFNEKYKGIKHLKTFYLAIKNKEVLQITNKGFQEGAPIHAYQFHPQVLKQYNRRWFVFGYNKDQNHKEWSVPLDQRIRKIEKLDEIEYKKTDTDWKNFFRTMVGVRREGTVQRVELRFFNGREKYFKTKSFIEGFEEFFEEEKSNQVWFDAIINRELVQQILSYGKDVEVIKPQILKDKINEHIKVMFANYN